MTPLLARKRSSACRNGIAVRPSPRAHTGNELGNPNPSRHAGQRPAPLCRPGRGWGQGLCRAGQWLQRGRNSSLGPRSALPGASWGPPSIAPRGPPSSVSSRREQHWVAPAARRVMGDRYMEWGGGRVRRRGRHTFTSSPLSAPSGRPSLHPSVRPSARPTDPGTVTPLFGPRTGEE